MKKKITSALLCALMLSQPYVMAESLVESPVDVEMSDAAVQENKGPTAAELEAMIKLVKPKLDIPEEYTEFSWNYNGKTAYSDASWYFTWEMPRSSDGKYGGNVSVNCDDSGRITSYSLYSPDRAMKLPKFTAGELEHSAIEFVNKVAPGSNLVLMKNRGYSSIYSGRYNYSFERVENGISYPENNATVGVDFITGKVTYYSTNYDFDIPVASSEGMMTADEAKKILSEKQNMLLSYVLNRSYDDDGNVTNRAVLVYTPEKSYISVDAKSGEVYYERSKWQSTDNIFGAAGGAMNDAVTKEESAESESDYRLSEEELKQLEILESLITRDEAIAKITENPAIYRDISLNIVDASLRRERSYEKNRNIPEDKFVWEINFSKPDKLDKYDYYAYAYARVDAKTGKILGFSSSLRGYSYYADTATSVPKNRLSEEECKKIFFDFVTSLYPEKTELARNISTYETNVVEYNTDIDGNSTPVYGAYGINFVRVNEGVDYTRDGFSGTVDAVSGKISQFNLTWTDNIVFDSPADAIGEQAAFDKFCEYAVLAPYYERYDEYMLDPDILDEKDKLRAFVVSIKENTAEYENIANKLAPGIDMTALRNALLAADEYGLIKLAADYFGVEAPDASYFYYGMSDLYTRESTARLVYKTKASSLRVSAIDGKNVDYSGNEIIPEYYGDISDISGHWAERYITILTDLGIIPRSEFYRPDEIVTEQEFNTMLSYADIYIPDSEADGEFTRIDAVKKIIDGLGYSKIASIPGIYKTEFSDNPETAPSDIGYLAIASGLGIIDGDAGTKAFRPSEELTRAEAAKLVITSITARE